MLQQTKTHIYHLEHQMSLTGIEFRFRQSYKPSPGTITRWAGTVYIGETSPRDAARRSVSVQGEDRVY